MMRVLVPRSRQRRLLLACALLLGTACQEDFDPYIRLQALRVLAIQNDPVMPAFGETTTMQALVYVPPGGATPTYEWSWCPFAGGSSDGYPCLVTEEQLADYGVDGMVPPFDLGTGETASFEHTVSPEILRQLCAVSAEQPVSLNCEQGFPAQIKLTVRSGEQTVTSVRRLRLRFEETQPPNLNPVIDGITVLKDGEELPMMDVADPAISIPRDLATDVRAEIDPDIVEKYLGKNVDGVVEELDERVTFTWFVESGSVDSERTGYIKDLTDLDVAVKNNWEPGELDDYPADTARMIVVLRDNRDGVTWTSGAVRLKEAP